MSDDYVPHSFAEYQQQAQQAAMIHRPRAPEPVVHLFEGAPKNEEKKTPCGDKLVMYEPGGGYTLTGLRATTAIDRVTCLGCLRALIPKGK